MKRTNKSIAVDVATKTGWAVCSGRKRLIDSGKIDTSKLPAKVDRMYAIYCCISEVLTKHSPRVMIIEDTFVSVNPRTAKVLDNMRGAVMIAGKQHGCDIYETPNREWKLLRFGSGKIEKKEIKAAICDHYNRKFTGDEADAIAMCEVSLEIEEIRKEEFRRSSNGEERQGSNTKKRRRKTARTKER